MTTFGFRLLILLFTSVTSLTAQAEQTLSCASVGIASFAMIDYSVERTYFGDATGVPTPLALKDQCSDPSTLGSPDLQAFIKKIGRVQTDLAQKIYGESFSNLLPIGLHLLVVLGTPGGDIFSAGPSPIQTGLNSTPSGHGGSISLLNSLKLNIATRNLSSFDEAIYSHEATHALLEASDFIQRNYPLLKKLGDLSSHFNEFFCDLSAQIARGRVFELNRFSSLLPLRGLTLTPYSYSRSNRKNMTISASANSLIAAAGSLGLDAEMVQALKLSIAGNKAQRLDPHLTGVSFGRVLARIPSVDVGALIRASFKSGSSAQDALNALLSVLTASQRVSFERDLDTYQARNWIRYIDSGLESDLFAQP
jgi:hypothetical protein